MKSKSAIKRQNSLKLGRGGVVAVVAGNMFLFILSDRLKEGQNTKKLHSAMQMEGYLRTRSGGISPLMLSSLAH